MRKYAIGATLAVMLAFVGSLVVVILLTRHA